MIFDVAFNEMRVAADSERYAQGRCLEISSLLY